MSSIEDNAFSIKLKSLFGDLNEPIKTSNQDVCIYVHLKREGNHVSMSQLRLLLFVSFVANLTGKK